MYKELKLKANHNHFWYGVRKRWVVIKCTKSWSWKQITTSTKPPTLRNMLLSNVQRAEVESKSQQSSGESIAVIRCYQMYKELKLKANHNHRVLLYCVLFVVIKCTKSWSWKQITTIPGTVSSYILLLSNVQRAEVESKSLISCANPGNKRSV